MVPNCRNFVAAIITRPLQYTTVIDLNLAVFHYELLPTVIKVKFLCSYMIEDAVEILT